MLHILSQGYPTGQAVTPTSTWPSGTWWGGPSFCARPPWGTRWMTSSPPTSPSCSQTWTNKKLWEWSESLQVGSKRCNSMNYITSGAIKQVMKKAIKFIWRWIELMRIAQKFNKLCAGHKWFLSFIVIMYWIINLYFCNNLQRKIPEIPYLSTSSSPAQ